MLSVLEVREKISPRSGLAAEAPDLREDLGALNNERGRTKRRGTSVRFRGGGL